MRKYIYLFFFLGALWGWAQPVKMVVYVADDAINQIKITHLASGSQTFDILKKRAEIKMNVHQSDLYFLSTNLSDTVFSPILLKPGDQINFEIYQDSVLRLRGVKGSKELDYIATFMNEFYKAKRDLNRFEISYLNASPSLKNILYMQYGDFYERINNKLGSILLKHKESMANIVLMRAVDLGHNPTLYQQLLSVLTDRYADNVYVKDLVRDTMELQKEFRYRNIVSTDCQQRLSSLSQYDGHYILLQFWASWSKPSRKENATVVKLYDKYHDSKALQIFSVGIEADEAAWIEAIAEDHLKWTSNVSDLKAWQSEIVKDYNVKTLPLYFMIDPEGNILFSEKSIKGIESFLDEEFKNYVPEKK